MDKNAIKKYAIWARRELLDRVSQRAQQFGITVEGYDDYDADTINGHLLTASEKAQRQALIRKIQKDGYEQAMETAAYTWFNRFSALRFMEVNGYLPSHVRVFTDDDNKFKPQIITEAIHLEIDGLDMEKVYEMKETNRTDELYKYLLITQCNALGAILPGMFTRIKDYTELLFPDNLLREGSVIEQMVALIPQEDWTDQIQIIGWLYQYYNSERKDEVFTALKKNVKITKENIPAATQLFTPDWIVRYMVENSLGRLWVEGHPNEELKASWKYYLEEAEQEPEVQAQLDEIRKEYAALKPEDIRCIDPCMGSGHILVYMFDVLMQIYEAYGYTTREAVSLILRKNLYGLDLDDRAAQLAYFSVMMEARQYDRRFFSRGIQPCVYGIQESNHIRQATRDYFCNGDPNLTRALDTICTELHDAKEYGSILTVTGQDWNALYNRFDEIFDDTFSMERSFALELLPMVRVAEALAQKYDVVVTNPPYMGASNMNAKLNQFIKDYYTDYKSDFFSSFVIRASRMTKPDGYCGFFTPYVWMFIQSYEKMRHYLYHNATIETLIQFEYSAFEEATVPVCTFAFKNSHIKKNGCYLRLTDFRGGMEVQRQKTLEAISNHECGFYYEQLTDNFEKIPGSPVAYWWKNYKIFDVPTISNYYESAGRNKTHGNELYVRSWWEISDKIRWQPYANGGEFRRWAGNDYDLVDWSESAKMSYASHGGLYNQKYAGLQGVCWNLITSYKNGFRMKNPTHHYSSAAPTIIESSSNNLDYYLLSYLNSFVGESILKMFNPTLNTTVGDVLALPLIINNKEEIDEISMNNEDLSRTDWDSYETSWDFKRHPLI